MLIENIRLIIFDLDDTLYPEIEFVKSGFRKVAEFIERDLGINRDFIFQTLLEKFNENRKFVFNRLLQEIKISDDYLFKLIDIYRTHKPKISLYDDTKKVLPLLKNRFHLGLITDGYPITQKLKVEALGIEKYFEKIIYTWEKGMRYSKPSVEPFLDILEYFSCAPREAVYIGDNVEKDFKGPKEIGIFTIKILRDGIYKNSIPPDDSYEPDFIIGSLLDIEDLF